MLEFSPDGEEKVAISQSPPLNHASELEVEDFVASSARHDSNVIILEVLFKDKTRLFVALILSKGINITPVILEVRWLGRVILLSTFKELCLWFEECLCVLDFLLIPLLLTVDGLRSIMIFNGYFVNMSVRLSILSNGYFDLTDLILSRLIMLLLSS